ncbi:MAG: hypothetical protein V4669_13765 [Pseudomonadota bacterium]
MDRTFTARNAAGASVHDVEALRTLDQVLSVDIDAGCVVRAETPLRCVDDEIATYTEHYRSIYPIYGGQTTPQLFHCYGRQA